MYFSLRRQALYHMACPGFGVFFSHSISDAQAFSYQLSRYLLSPTAATTPLPPFSSPKFFQKGSAVAASVRTWSVARHPPAARRQSRRVMAFRGTYADERGALFRGGGCCLGANGNGPGQTDFLHQLLRTGYGLPLRYPLRLRTRHREHYVRRKNAIFFFARFPSSQETGQASASWPWSNFQQRTLHTPYSARGVMA